MRDRGARREEVAVDVRDVEGRRRNGKGGQQQGSQRGSKVLFYLQMLGIVVGVCSITSFLLSSMSHKRNKASALDSDDMILKRATKEVNMWAKTGEMPTFGITRGRYNVNTKFCNFCGGDLEWCRRHNETNTTTPPVELLPPGRLVTRILGEKSVCFLWYSSSFYSRPQGGFNGIGIWRVGGVDSKNGLLMALHKYEAQFSCAPYQTYPVSLDLSKEENCEAFRTADGTPAAALSKVLWFIKSSNGSTGDHIQLARGDEVAQGGSLKRECTGKCRTEIKCPTPNVIASMNVRDIWTVGGKKFDNRAYLLIASVDPLVVFYRMGHLRFSVLNYTGADNLDPNVHVTNPRFAANLTGDAEEFIKPFDTLKDELVRLHGSAKGMLKFAAAKQSVMNAMLSTVYAFRGRIEHKEMWGMVQQEGQENQQNKTHRQMVREGYELRWSYLFMALDIAFDSRQNAYVLDVNTGLPGGPTPPRADAGCDPPSRMLTSAAPTAKHRSLDSHFSLPRRACIHSPLKSPSRRRRAIVLPQLVPKP